MARLSGKHQGNDVRGLHPSTVTVPVLFFVGKYDRSIGPESYKDLHFTFLESPEEWAAALDDYKEL